MPTSTFHKVVFGCLLVFGFASCQSTPKPELDSSSIVVPEEKIVKVEPLPAAEPEIDFNLQIYEEALDALKAEQVQFAIDLLVQLIQDAPELRYLYTNLGLAYLKQNKLADAGKAFDNAIKSNKNDAVAYNHLGIIKRSQGDFESALATYQKAIELKTDYASAYLNLGILYDIYLQKLEPALEQYRRYQVLTDNQNESVASWIIDIERRIKSKANEANG